MRQETIHIDIFKISKDGDRKIIKAIRITSRSPTRKRCGINLTISDEHLTKKKIYRKNLDWLHFDNEPRVQERHQV